MGYITTRDGGNQSMWQSEGGMLSSPPPEDIVYDVLVVGGGITGISAALMLQNQGRKCILAEAHTIAFGTTGGTSAHINTFADTTYKEAADAFGEKGAQLFADAIEEACILIRDQVHRYHIDCDYEEKAGYLYAAGEPEQNELDEIMEYARKVGVSVERVPAIPGPFPFSKALMFPRQAQFHPVKYVRALCEAFIEAGGVLSENTLIENVESGDSVHTAKAGGKIIRAKHLIYATHLPPGINLLSFRCAPYRSYVLGVTLRDNNYPDGLVYDMQDPYHYFRTHTVNGRKLLVAGGNDHKTGHGDPVESFAKLEEYLREYYDIGEIVYKWSSQYYVPVDGLPYIGQMPMTTDRIYCATGYNGNGMMLGTIAAKILADIIVGKDNRFAELFSPGRLKPVAGFTEFVKENADVVGQFVSGHLSAEEIETLSEIKNGMGEVVRFKDRKTAVYKDENGKVYALHPVCTHAGCVVTWNGEERTWDCPCHGARYSISGEVLTGPATKGLDQVGL